MSFLLPFNKKKKLKLQRANELQFVSHKIQVDF